jgi:Glutathione S-transferase, N-terminal domain
VVRRARSIVLVLLSDQSVFYVHSVLPSQPIADFRRELFLSFIWNSPWSIWKDCKLSWPWALIISHTVSTSGHVIITHTLMTGNLIVHHLNNSRSQRVLWVLVCPTHPSPFHPPLLTYFLSSKEELEVPYEIKFYQRGPDLRAPKELLDFHPLGRVPIITDGDITLAESGAIIRAYSVFHSSLLLTC